MRADTFSIRSHHSSKSAVEKAAQAIFTACGFFAVLAVASITLYMVISGTPALFKVGILEILFGTIWQPAAASPSFGILYVILTSIAGTFLAILIGVPIGVMTAIFLAEVAPKRVADIVRPAVELLAGIPSVIYGLLGILILNPLISQHRRSHPLLQIHPPQPPIIQLRNFFITSPKPLELLLRLPLQPSLKHLRPLQKNRPPNSLHRIPVHIHLFSR